jgi:hypothetical protein
MDWYPELIINAVGSFQERRVFLEPGSVIAVIILVVMLVDVARGRRPIPGIP